MRTWTETHREGTLLGPIDWSYDFTKHDWGEGHGGYNPESTPYSVKALREVEALNKAGKIASVMCYGSRRRVLAIGMYDGWPYWEPTPSVLLDCPMGGEWTCFLSIRDAKEESAK